MVVADAPPVIVLVAASDCLHGITTESLPPIAMVFDNRTPSRYKVNVPADAEVLLTIMSVTTVVVPDGTVYRVVVSVVDAAPRYRGLERMAIRLLPSA